MRRRNKSFSVYPVHTHAQPSLLPVSTAGVVHLLKLMHLHWHIVITQSSQFTLGFILSVVYSLALDKYIMTCIHGYGIIQSIFTAIKILCVLHIQTFSPPCACPPSLPPLTTFYCLHSFAFSGMYICNHTVFIYPFHIDFFHLVIYI